MKKTLMLLAVLALLAVPATAQTFDWSHPGSTGNLHQSAVFNASTTGPTLKFRSTSTTSFTARYNVTNTVGSGTTTTPAWSNLTAALTDDSNLGSVTITLYELDKCSGTTTQICQIASSDDPAAQCETCNFSSSTFDFANNSYWIEAVFARTSTAANAQLHSVAID